mmetsp:Transcript_7135/g.22837  ORF Transcript_7135/g.22837 Transcript_7135/m.22837 type:complete len:655 (-) Transcript_7135:46-2010(-)
MYRSLVLLCGVSLTAAVRFTGDVVQDFTKDTAVNPATGKPYNANVVTVSDGVRSAACDNNACPDVGVPMGFCSGGVCPDSGFDIRSIYFQYDPDQDTIDIGIDCFGICGDADGDGDPSSAGPRLVVMGGNDAANFAGSETVSIALDFDMDVAETLPSLATGLNVPWDFVIGYPRSYDSRGGERLPCEEDTEAGDADHASASKCFGLYEYASDRAASADGSEGQAAHAFGSPVEWNVEDRNPNPDAVRPGLEWRINDVSGLQSRTGSSPASPTEPWVMLGQAYAGSTEDGSIGADWLPSAGDFFQVDFPCLEFDLCGVCLGDNSTCADCAGVPNGDAELDVCGVCNGDGDTCDDCLGVAAGTATYDECGVCAGDSSSCRDCAGELFGSSVEDACGVCNGDSTECEDCNGIANGGAMYDVCDVCDGDGSSCLDCAGVPNGPAMVDECGVCNGDNTECADCLGTPNGPATYDVCDVCVGDGLSCLDCNGIPNGPAIYDACDVCDGDSSVCIDCEGVANGGAEIDECGICGGDGTSCVDCAGVVNGTAMYDPCGVCEGDGSDCLCLKLNGCDVSEVDHALLEWSVVATTERIDHSISVLEGLKEELCHYDVKRGNLQEDIATYLNTANEFRDVLDNFAYVQMHFKESLDEALQQIAAQ